MKIFISTMLVTSSITSAAIAGNPAPVVPAAIAPIAPIAVSVTDWSGPYVGGLVSLNSGSMDYFGSQDIHNVYPLNDDAGMYGVFAGYQHQMGSFVVGGEVAYQMGEIDLSKDQNYQIENFLDLKARLGFVAGNALIYATGGYSSGRYTEKDGNVVDYFIDLSGFNVGAGVDFKIGERLFIGAEYLYRETGGDYYDSNVESGKFQTQSIQLRAGLQF